MDLTKLRFNVDTVALDEAIKKLDEVAAATKRISKTSVSTGTGASDVAVVAAKRIKVENSFEEENIMHELLDFLFTCFM